jgi:hypothetical protein
MMSEVGDYAPLLRSLPEEVPALVRTLQGLVLHVFWAERYGVRLSDERKAEVQIRPVRAKLARLLEIDSRPLSEARPPELRLVGNCRDFSLLLAAMLKAQGIPARARCGFGTYFMPDHYEDHWVGEYWNDAERRWVMVDSQLDERQRRLFGIEFDPLDVPRERFLVAADAWDLARTGRADPEAFGILDMGGLWFIAGNLVRDAAALNNRDADLDLGFLDRLATLTREPDRYFHDLRAIYSDDRVRVPPTVFNVVLSRPEAA